MIFVLLMVLIGLGPLVLVLVLVPAKKSVRHQFVPGVSAPTIRPPRTVADDADLPPGSGWTALDDQQLTRFLKRFAAS